MSETWRDIQIREAKGRLAKLLDELGIVDQEHAEQVAVAIQELIEAVGIDE